VFDTALLHGIFRSLGGDDTMYDASVIRSGNLLLFLGPCPDLPEVPREKFMKFLSISDRDLLQEDGFGREHMELL